MKDYYIILDKDKRRVAQGFGSKESAEQFAKDPNSYAAVFDGPFSVYKKRPNDDPSGAIILPQRFNGTDKR